MIGWAAVTGDVGLQSLVLFAIIFMWTPPHFWALALYRDGDYAKAGVPMLPVVAGREATKRQILLYTLLLIPVTFPARGSGHGGAALWDRRRGAERLFPIARLEGSELPDSRVPRKLFGFSILYLFLLFGLLMFDRAPGVLSGLTG